MLIPMQFLFREQRKYLLHANHFKNHVTLTRQFDGSRIRFSDKEMEARPGYMATLGFEPTCHSGPSELLRLFGLSFWKG